MQLIFSGVWEIWSTPEFTIRISCKFLGFLRENLKNGKRKFLNILITEKSEMETENDQNIDFENQQSYLIN